jgi:tetratricopeptide (TPR) repeat protein
MADSARIEELRRRVQLDPASIAFAALAEEYRRVGRYAEAVATCEAGLQRHPAYLSARVTLGRALLEMGEFDHAADELQRVLRIAPENLSAIRALADIHERRKKQRAAQESDDLVASLDASSGPAPLKVASIADGEHPLPVRGQAPPPLEPTAAAPSTVGGDTTASVPIPVPVGHIQTTPHRQTTSHPAAAALPALEAFLDAIVRVRGGAPRQPLVR